MHERKPPRAILFDFDGTLSTLRSGWEAVMRPLMLETIDPAGAEGPALAQAIDAYIDSSTGIQTIYQMQWLREEVLRRGHSPQVLDAWDYKDEYNRRLMQAICRCIDDVRTGRVPREAHLLEGSVALLDALRAYGIPLYVASGTDDADVKNEAQVLCLTPYFTRIAGAPHRRADCSKEAVLRALIAEGGLAGNDLLVIGDGKVEIALGREVGARTLGVASDEAARQGINPVKEARLTKAGADWIVGDYTDTEGVLRWMGLQN